MEHDTIMKKSPRKKKIGDTCHGGSLQGPRFFPWLLAGRRKRSYHVLFWPMSSATGHMERASGGLWDSTYGGGMSKCHYVVTFSDSSHLFLYTYILAFYLRTFSRICGGAHVGGGGGFFKCTSGCCWWGDQDDGQSVAASRWVECLFFEWFMQV